MNSWEENEEFTVVLLFFYRASSLDPRALAYAVFGILYPVKAKRRKGVRNGPDRNRFPESYHASFCHRVGEYTGC